jgi:hypothetical protein
MPAAQAMMPRMLHRLKYLQLVDRSDSNHPNASDVTLNPLTPSAPNASTR